MHSVEIMKLLWLNSCCGFQDGHNSMFGLKDCNNNMDLKGVGNYSSYVQQCRNSQMGFINRILTSLQKDNLETFVFAFLAIAFYMSPSLLTVHKL